MLKIVKTSLVIAATFGVSGLAQANVNEALANICTIVQADDKGELRKKMRTVASDYRLKLKDYYSGVSCSGNSLIRTAMLSNAVEAGYWLRRCQRAIYLLQKQMERPYKRGYLSKV